MRTHFAAVSSIGRTLLRERNERVIVMWGKCHSVAGRKRLNVAVLSQLALGSLFLQLEKFTLFGVRN